MLRTATPQFRSNRGYSTLNQMECNSWTNPEHSWVRTRRGGPGEGGERRLEHTSLELGSNYT